MRACGGGLAVGGLAGSDAARPAGWGCTKCDKPAKLEGIRAPRDHYGYRLNGVDMK